jgi:hypothetical protein
MRRVDILPIWRHRYTLKTGIEPDGDVATYSGATPQHSFSLHQNLKTDGEPFYLYLEINAPRDANQFFHSERPKDHPGFMKPGLGQPSLIYGAHIELDKPKQYLLLDLIGRGGSTRQRDGNIHYELKHVTSASQLIEKVLIRVKRLDPNEPAQTQGAAETTSERRATD